MKIRIDFTCAGIDESLDVVTPYSMYYLLLGALADDTTDWKRLSKFVYNLEIPLTNDDS